MRNRSLTIVLAAAALFGALAAVVYLGRSGAPSGTGTALIGGPFSLTDHTGKAVTEKDFRNRKTLVFFGFTSCPDICPSGLQVMAAALDKLGPKADQLVPLFVTVDPERDTAEKLAQYVKSFHPKLIGLTGTEEQVKAVAKAYRVYFKKIPDEKTPGAYTVDHSAFFYLMDENGGYVRHFSHSVDPDTLAAELAKSL
jgi:protein SCO1/2